MTVTVHPASRVWEALQDQGDGEGERVSFGLVWFFLFLVRVYLLHHTPWSCRQACPFLLASLCCNVPRTVVPGLGIGVESKAT